MSDVAKGSARPLRIVALVIGCLLLLPALAAFVGGGALGLGYAFGRDGSGFFDTSLDRLESSTPAVVTDQVDFAAEPGDPGWVIESLDADIRLRVTNASTEKPVFVGIASQADVDRYLDGVAHDVVRDLHGRSPVYRNRPGRDQVAAPIAQDFWVASANGTGTQELVWPAKSGRWAAVVMNADGSPGVAADVDVGAKAGFVLPLAIILLAVGVVATTVAVVLIAYGARGLGGERQGDGAPHPYRPEPITPIGSGPRSPVRLDAHLDPDLSRWLWLVKWFLAIPHFVVLAFLWLAFVVLTVVAGFTILFTGRYPEQIFDFNVGVMRWTWRVSYYATTGGLGTDRYPPFSLHPDPSYPASLHIDRPGELSRGLVLVKWWLLAIPHYLIIGLFTGSAFWTMSGDDAVRSSPSSGGLLGVLVVIAGLILLFRSCYPPRLFDLIIGLNRWIFRVIAYAALMTDTYPPFQLDQGGTETFTSGEGDGATSVLIGEGE